MVHGDVHLSCFATPDSVRHHEHSMLREFCIKVMQCLTLKKNDNSSDED